MHPKRLKQKHKNIVTVYLPHNTTYLPPLDPGIVQSFKKKYGMKLMRFGESQSTSEIASTINILQAIQWVFLFFCFNWDSHHARLNSLYEEKSYKEKKHKKITAYRKSV